MLTKCCSLVPTPWQYIQWQWERKHSWASKALDGAEWPQDSGTVGLHAAHDTTHKIKAEAPTDSTNNTKSLSIHAEDHWTCHQESLQMKRPNQQNRSHLSFSCQFAMHPQVGLRPPGTSVDWEASIEIWCVCVYIYVCVCFVLYIHNIYIYIM